MFQTNLLPPSPRQVNSSTVMEAASCSDTLEHIYRITWHYVTGGDFHSHRRENLKSVAKMCTYNMQWINSFRNKASFSDEELLVLQITPQARRSLLVGCPRLLFQYIRRYPPYWRPQQPEDAPCRGDRNPLILEDLGVDGRIVLIDLQKVKWRMYWIYLAKNRNR